MVVGLMALSFWGYGAVHPHARDMALNSIRTLFAN